MANNQATEMPRPGGEFLQVVKVVATPRQPSKKRVPPSFHELGSETVVIKVENQEFVVHKKLACYHSPFFRAAFEGGFAESVSQTIEMKETTSPAFGLVLEFMYTGDIHDRSDQLPNPHDLCNLWLLADKLLMPALQNLATRIINDQFMATNRFWAGAVGPVYRNTMSGSPFRRLLLSHFILLVTSRTFHEQAASVIALLCPEFLADVIFFVTKHPVPRSKKYDIKMFMIPIPGDA